MKTKIFIGILIIICCLAFIVLPVTAYNEKTDSKTETIVFDEDLVSSKMIKSSALQQLEDSIEIKSQIEESKKGEVKKTETSDLVENKKENTVEETVNDTTDKPIDTTESVEADVETTEIVESNNYSLGTFKLTAYCACSKCCGQWAGGPTASGVMPTTNRTIAVDTSVIPFGTTVMINGRTYVAEDTGSGVNGNKIDIFFSSHQDALNFGVQYAEVFVCD